VCTKFELLLTFNLELSFSHHSPVFVGYELTDTYDPMPAKLHAAVTHVPNMCLTCPLTWTEKAKFHYASWFGAGSEHVQSYSSELVRSWFEAEIWPIIYSSLLAAN